MQQQQQGNCNSNSDVRNANPASNSVVDCLVVSDVLEVEAEQSGSNESDSTQDDSEWLEDELELILEENGIVEVVQGVSDPGNSFVEPASNATQGPPCKKQKQSNSKGGPSLQTQGGEHEQAQPAEQGQLQGGVQRQEQFAKQEQVNRPAMEA